MATINKIDGFAHTIADTPRGERQSKPIGLDRSGPAASPSSSSSPRRKTGWSTNAWNGWKQPRPKPTSGSIGWTATPETSKATTTNERSAAGSWPSPQPVLNSNPRLALTQDDHPATSPAAPGRQLPLGGDAKPRTQPNPSESKPHYPFTSPFIPSLIAMTTSLRWIWAKASAALSRRCLQHILQEKSDAKTQNDLAKTIGEVIDDPKTPRNVADSLDMVRNIGNFSAHPNKSTNIGGIVPVEPVEAEWCLEVIEMLFDFYFVRPSEIQRRRDRVDEKLAAAGKPPNRPLPPSSSSPSPSST